MKLLGFLLFIVFFCIFIMAFDVDTDLRNRQVVSGRFLASGYIMPAVAAAVYEETPGLQF